MKLRLKSPAAIPVYSSAIAIALAKPSPDVSQPPISSCGKQTDHACPSMYACSKVGTEAMLLHSGQKDMFMASSLLS